MNYENMLFFKILNFRKFYKSVRHTESKYRDVSGKNCVLFQHFDYVNIPTNLPLEPSIKSLVVLQLVFPLNGRHFLINIPLVGK